MLKNYFIYKNPMHYSTHIASSRVNLLVKMCVSEIFHITHVSMQEFLICKQNFMICNGITGASTSSLKRYFSHKNIHVVVGSSTNNIVGLVILLYFSWVETYFWRRVLKLKEKVLFICEWDINF